MAALWEMVRIRVRIGWAELARNSSYGMPLYVSVAALVALYLCTYHFPVERIFPEYFRDGPAQFADRVRWFGILLEVFSIGMIVRGLYKALKAYGKPGVLQRIFGWVSEFRYVFVKRPTRYASGTGMAAGSGQFAAAGGTTMLKGLTLQQQIDSLVGQVGMLSDSVTLVRSDVSLLKRDVEQKLEAEREARARAERTIQERLEDQLVGDFNMEIAGLILLVFSIFLANAPAECAILLTKLALGK